MSTGVIDMYWINTYGIWYATKDEIKKALKGFIFSKVIYLDVTYTAVKTGDMYEILTQDFIDKKRYIRDLFDCDDFANVFRCHMIEQHGITAVGVVYNLIMKHAYNVIITRSKDGYDAWIYEPQTDDLWSLDDAPLRRRIGCIIII